MSKNSIKNQLLAEFIGTAALLCAVIGSGIMATVFALFVLIEILGPISGAHFNPFVTLVIYFKNKSNIALAGAFNACTAILFIVFQLLGASLGAWLANAMFDMPVLQFSAHLRGGTGQWLAEAVATAGLIIVILRSGAANVHAKASALVACYIGAAYWFTASTSFANPAAVMGRMLSDSFAGIAPASALGFVAAQAFGAVVGVGINHLLEPVSD
jgi:glycerol uptake facilitator-like aquaporin